MAKDSGLGVQLPPLLLYLQIGSGKAQYMEEHVLSGAKDRYQLQEDLYGVLLGFGDSIHSASKKPSENHPQCATLGQHLKFMLASVCQVSLQRCKDSDSSRCQFFGRHCKGASICCSAIAV